MKRLFLFGSLFFLAVVLSRWPLGFQAKERGVSLKPVYVYQGSAPPPEAVLDPTGRYLYLLAEPNEWNIKVIDWSENQVVKVLDFSDLPCFVGGVAVSARARKPIFGPELSLAYLTYCNTAYVLNLDTLQIESALTDWQTDGCAWFAQSSTGTWLALAHCKSETRDFTVTLLRPPEFRPTSKWSVPGNKIAFSPSGDQLAVLGNSDPSRYATSEGTCPISVHDVPSGKLLYVSNLQLDGKSCPFSLFQYLQNSRGALVALDLYSRGIVLWDVQSGKSVMEITDEKPIENIALSPDGKLIFGAVWVRRATLQQDFKIWHTRTGSVVYESPMRLEVLHGEKKQFTPSGSFSENGRFLVVATSGGVIIYEIETKQLSKDAQDRSQ